jgi:type VI secretion system protein ImpE
MSPIELFHEAQLSEAVAAQKAVVESRPDDVAEHLLLCELLAFTGDRNAVRHHLDQLSYAPAKLQPYVAEWRDLLNADETRDAGGRPSFILDPPEHLLRRLDAMRQHQAGEIERALDLLDTADETAPWVEGFVDGRPFEGCRDADDLFGPTIEIIVGRQVAWVPVEQIRKFRLEDAQSLRDELCRPATVWLIDGTELEVFIPVLYPGTASHPEEGIRTGAGIDWVERGGLMRGLGSRTFLFGEEEVTLAEFRQVEVRPA